MFFINIPNLFSSLYQNVMIYFFHTVHTEFMYMYMAEVLLFPISVHVYTVKDKIVKFQP